MMFWAVGIPAAFFIPTAFSFLAVRCSLNRRGVLIREAFIQKLALHIQKCKASRWVEVVKVGRRRALPKMVLGYGILTALEVANLDLQDTDLVVLSACDTGLGSIHNTEGVFGLQRAFKFAGADNILVSLWSVNDRATKELMIRFYRNLLKKEQSPAVALRNAKADIRKKNPNPRFWAGFILVE